jgi:Protein of unknown function (DUF4238)
MTLETIAPSTNRKRNHHTLPRLYLRGFAAAPTRPFVWEYSKGMQFNPGRNRNKNNPIELPLKRAGAELDAYSYRRRDGTLDTDTFENALEKREKPADRILRKIRMHQVLSADDKEIFAKYIILMHKRVPRRKESIREKWPELIASSRTIQALRSPEVLTALSEERRAEVRRVLEKYDHGPIDEVMLGSMIIDWEATPAVLAAMYWRFLIAEGDYLYLTSDDPVFTFGALGLNKFGSELSFPITSTICLAASWQHGEEGYISAHPSFVKQLNCRTASNAAVLYYARAEEWPLSFLGRSFYDVRLLDLAGMGQFLWENREVPIFQNESDTDDQ